MWDDIGLLAFAMSLIVLTQLYRDLMADYTALSNQADVTLQTMAKAVSQMQVHVKALAAPDNDQATIDALVLRLKVGTDQLAAAIEAAQLQL